MYQPIAEGTLTVNNQPSLPRGENGGETWNQHCLKSIQRERAEVEKRYGIKIGQTDIYCAKCGRPWGFGGHVCQDTRLKELQLKKREKNSEVEKAENEAWAILRHLGPQKVSIYLMLPVGTVNTWIKRRNIPKRHLEKLVNLKKRV